jgi:hypothetical protein
MATEMGGANVKSQSSLQLVQVMQASARNVGGSKRPAATKEVVYGMMDHLVEGFDFIILITAAKTIPFSEAYQISFLSGMQLIGIIAACVRKMLISFDLPV